MKHICLICKAETEDDEPDRTGLGSHGYCPTCGETLKRMIEMQMEMALYGFPEVSNETGTSLP